LRIAGALTLLYLQRSVIFILTIKELEAKIEDIFAMDTLERDDMEVVKRNVGLKHDVRII